MFIALPYSYQRASLQCKGVMFEINIRQLYTFGCAGAKQGTRRRITDKNRGTDINIQVTSKGKGPVSEHLMTPDAAGP